MKKNLLVLSLLTLGLGLFAQTPRLCLYEEFTGETCPPCASTNPGLNLKLQQNSAKIVAIKWQVPIPSTPTNTWSLYKTNKAEIDWRYKSLANGGYGYIPAVTYAPFGKIDGQSQAAFGATGANADHPANLTAGMISTAQSYTSAFSITMNRAWDATGSAVNLTVNIQASAPFTSTGPLVFRTVMIERLITFSVQPGTNGEKTFEDVAIASFPSIQTGTALPGTWTLGQSVTFTLNCPIPSYTRKKDEVAFVGFIQDDGNQKVAQAVKAEKEQMINDAVAVAAKVPVTCANSIIPEITVSNNGSAAITALTITPYSDGVAGNVTTWTGNLASGATTTIQLNSITSSTTSGTHTFSYNITAMNGTDFNLTNNGKKVNYMVAGNFLATPVSEGFVLGTWPPAGWAWVNPNAGTPGWARTNAAGAYNISPLESSKYSFFTNTVIGDQDELYLPPVDLGGSGDPMMTFDVAYAQRNSSSDDALDVFVSDNCGNSWTNVYNSHGTALATTGPISTDYTPDPNDPTNWRTETVMLTGFAKNNVLVKFVTTSDNGNNLFLDNVNLAANTTGVKKLSASQTGVVIYPNPANGTTNMRITATKAGEAKISVTNAIGQVVYTKSVTLIEGFNTVQMDVKEFATGVYNVTVVSNEGVSVKKLNVTK